MLIRLAAPADNERGPRYAEQWFAALHQGNRQRLPIRLHFARAAPQTGLFVEAPALLKPLLSDQLAATYPHVAQERLAADALEPPSGQIVHSAALRLAPDLFPIRRHSQFEDPLTRQVTDPLAGLLAAIASTPADPTRAVLTLEILPATRRTVRRARRALRRLAWPLFQLHPWVAAWYANVATRPRVGSQLVTFVLTAIARLRGRTAPQDAVAPTHKHERELALQAAGDKLSRHLFEVRARITVAAPAGERTRCVQKLHDVAGALGQFTAPNLSQFQLGKASARRAPTGEPWLLSAEELATLFHPATETVRAATMATADSRRLEPPVEIPSEKEAGVVVLGRLDFRGRSERFGLRIADRRRHVVVVGKTGMGKSTLLERMLAGDMEAGRGVGVIDPHGDLAEAVLRRVPRRRSNDVVLFDAGDRAFPPAFNPLACSDPVQRPLVASAVVTAFKKLYGDSWGPRLEHILRNALLTLLEAPAPSLTSLLRLLGEPDFRRRLLQHVQDDLIRAFWREEFERWPARYQVEAVAPIQNKVGQFLANPLTRAIVGGEESRIDLRRILDAGQILIVNLSKGRIGEDAASLLGSLLIAGLQQAAMSRAELPEEERRDFFLAVDEFQNFSTESFATILSEARKYRLSLTLAHQYLAQLDEATSAAVFGNVGTLIAFQVGPQDAETLAEQLAGDLLPADLIGLPKHQAYARLLIDGQPSRPFSMCTLPPVVPGSDRSHIVRAVSRRRYARIVDPPLALAADSSPNARRAAAAHSP